MSSMYLTVKQAAEHLNVSTDTIYRLIREKAIPFAKIGGTYRFTQQALDDWMTGQMFPAADAQADDRAPEPPNTRTRTTRDVAAAQEARHKAREKANAAKTYAPPVRPGYQPITPVPFNL